MTDSLDDSWQMISMAKCGWRSIV